MIKKLDLYDQKILSELDKNSRIPASQIAHKVKLSKVSVNNRIKRLKEKGIIRNFMTQINYGFLGYNISHVYYLLQYLPAEKEKKFFDFLCSLPNIAYVARIDGNFEVFVVPIYKSTEELGNILAKINEKYGRYIKERNILSVLNAFYFGRRYLADIERKKFDKTIERKKAKEFRKLDTIDNWILSEISLNARIPVIDLMQKLNLSKDIVHYRLRKLADDNIIQKFTIDLCHNNYGNSFFKLLIRLSYKPDINKFISKINSNKNLIRIVRLLGTWDLELDFEVKDNREMRDIVKDLKSKFGEFIQYSNLLFVYRIDKINYYPFKKKLEDKNLK